MKIIEEMRERKAFEQSKRSGPLSIVLGVVIAFGVGLLGVAGLIKAPSFMQAERQAFAAATKPADDTINSASGNFAGAGGRRIGRAETAPLLKSCVPFAKFGIDKIDQVSPAELYRLLQSTSRVSRFAAMAKVSQKGFESDRFATVWAEVADCVYKQNGWVFCDQDNRALAVEAATTFLRQLDVTEKERTETSENTRANPRRRENVSYAIQNANAIKDRMLSSLRYRVAEGRLVASDFGMFAPPEISQIMRDTKVTGSGCANRS